jgi:LAS superfamily LD-carboxypeptidase LdcB
MTSQYIKGEHIINGYTTSALKDGISLNSKIIKKKDTRETKRTTNKKSIKKSKIITQTHNKFEKRKKYIKDQKIKLNINIEHVIFNNQDIYIDLININNN